MCVYMLLIPCIVNIIYNCCQMGLAEKFGGWSDDGCELLSGENDTDTTVVCACDHLTHFGFLAVS